MESSQLPKEDQLQHLREKAYIPGMSVAVISDRKISETIVSGVSDIHTAKKVTNDTLFPVASLSKPVFAYLVFELIEQGILPGNFLDQRLYKILPEYQPFFADSHSKAIRFDSNETAKAVTPGLILSHRSDLPNWIDSKEPFQFPDEPTNKFTYSGEGYHYLQKVVELITKKSLQKLAREYLFDPLKMYNSSFSGPVIESKVAIGHDEDMNPKPVSGKPDENAGASLVTTASDLGLFVVQLLKQLNENPRFKEFMQAISPVMEDVQTDTSLSWTLGWGMQVTAGNAIQFHWGDVPNFKAFVAVNAKNGSAIVILTNSQNGMEIIQETINAVAPSIGNLNFCLDYLCEKYEYQQLNDTPGWQERYKGLLAEVNGDYSLALAHFEQAHILNSEDKMTVRHIEWLSNVITSLKQQVQLSTETLKQYEGRYGPLLITQQDGQLQVRVGGQTHTLLPLTSNTFLDNDDKVKLQFNLSTKPPSVTCQFLKDGNIVDFEVAPVVSTQSLFAASKQEEKNISEDKNINSLTPNRTDQ